MSNEQTRAITEILKYLMGVTSQLTYKQFFSQQVAFDWYRYKEILDGLEASLTKEVEIPKVPDEMAAVQIPGPPRKRALTPEQLQAMKDRMAKVRAARGKKGA